MIAEFAPFLLGTAYACMGLSGLRLARLDGQGFGWRRFCMAGILSALLEWYALYNASHGISRPNDLLGSLLALLAIAAWIEFARRALEHRFHPKPWLYVLIGIVVAGVGIATFALCAHGTPEDFHHGIYPRLVFTQHTFGTLLAALSLAVTASSTEPGTRWIRLASITLFLGFLGFWLLYATGAASAITRFCLVPGVAAAAILLRTAYVARQHEMRRAFGRWAFLEFAVIVILLVGALFAAHRHGRETLLAEQQHLLHTSKAAAASFSADSIKALQGTPNDIGTPNYETILQRLLTIQKVAHSTTAAEHSSRYAYLFTLRNDHVTFLALVPQNGEQPFYPGTSYDEASPELRRAFVEGHPFVEGPLPDRYGTWISAFAPIHEANGKLLALLGIDFDAVDWGHLEADAQLTTLLHWTLAMMIVLSLFTTIGLGLEAQHQLRRSERLFRTAADYTSTWDYWIGTDGKMIYTSLASEKITGYPPNHFIRYPRYFLKLVDPDDRERMIKHLRSCAHDAPTCEFDFKIIRKDGKPAWIKHSCESVYDDAGRWNGRRASNRDITDLRIAEMTLARQERLQGGCHQALRLLLGRDGHRHIREALDLAARAGGCCHAAIFRVGTDQHVHPLAVWPTGTTLPSTTIWTAWRERALPVLSVGESFELLPHETKDCSGSLSESYIVILPILERTQLTGAVALAVPKSHGAWSRVEIAALATLASGLSVALEREGLDQSDKNRA